MKAQELNPEFIVAIEDFILIIHKEFFERLPMKFTDDENL